MSDSADSEVDSRVSGPLVFKILYLTLNWFFELPVRDRWCIFFSTLSVCSGTKSWSGQKKLIIREIQQSLAFLIDIL